MNIKYSFSAGIKASDMGMTFVEIPFHVETEFDEERVKVKTEFETELYRDSLVRMKTCCHILGIKKTYVQKRICKLD